MWDYFYVILELKRSNSIQGRVKGSINVSSDRRLYPNTVAECAVLTRRNSKRI